MIKLLALAAALLLTGCSIVSGAPPAEPALQGEAQVTLLQTTDLHHVANGAGHVAAGHPGSPGAYARIAAYVEAVRGTAGHPVLLVDSGDWSMGTCYDLTLGQQPLALLFMDALAYDCATLGNHEFDYGPAGLARILEAGRSAFAFRTPLVASNLLLNGDGDLAPWVGPNRRVPPTRVQVLPNGLRVGYLGLVGRDAAGAAPAAAPVAFRPFDGDAAWVQALVDDLRQRQGCHLVIALSHAGTDAAGTSGEDVDLASRVRGIDVIASGHTHTSLPAAVTIANGTWTTRILDAGAYGTHVARLDLTYHAATGATEVTAPASQPMTDPGLAAFRDGLVPDPAFAFLVGATDRQLNQGLGAFFTRVASFPDYDPQDSATGLYHPVGTTAQDLVANGSDPVPGPNGLGNLCADAERAVPNLLLARILRAQGWNGSPGDPGLPALRARLQANGLDPQPFAAAVVATGVLRSSLRAGTPLSFADVYNILPLGASPDPAQALPIGYPLLGAYFTVPDLRKLCALQLAAQAGLVSGDFYLHLSGVRYRLLEPELTEFLRWATAAKVLATTSRRAARGSGPAQAALDALGSLASDAGAALLALGSSGNPYAAALATLQDGAQLAANLAVLGPVTLAAREASGLDPLLVGKALAAVGALEGFAPEDTACAGNAVPLDEAVRYRLAGSLYALLMTGGVRARFGLEIAAYRAAQGPDLLGAAGPGGIMANRVSLAPPGEPVQEIKEWMALLLYLTTPPTQGGHFPSGTISEEYASTPDPAQSSAWGAAVGVRSASYPALAIVRLRSILATLEAAS
jgi:2',3'-cyclic-nucleotide 2'-phosphodiesterase (5'-nucleotidase family)